MVLGTGNGKVVAPGLTKLLLQKLDGLQSQISPCENTQLVHASRRDRPHPVKLPHRQRLHKCQSLRRPHHKLPVGFAVIGSQLGQKLIVGNAGRGREPSFNQDFSPNFPRNLGGRGHMGQVFGYVEIGLVKRHGLNQGRVFGKYGPNLPRHFFVDRKAGRHEYQFRAFAQRYGRGHGRAHPKLPSLIAGRCYHPALSCATHRHGPATQFRVVTLLHRSKKCIHI